MTDSETQTRDVRSLPRTASELRAVTGDDGIRRIRGYGIVFNSLSEELADRDGRRFREEIAPEAFARSLSLGNDVRVTMNHNEDRILGRTSAGTARVGQDDIGIWYEVDLADTTAGRDTYTHIERGDIHGSSFTFTTPPKGVQWRTEGNQRIRRVVQGSMWELGPVTSPAYRASTAVTRSLAEYLETEEDEPVEDEEDRTTEKVDETNITAGDADEATRIKVHVPVEVQRLRIAC